MEAWEAAAGRRLVKAGRARESEYLPTYRVRAVHAVASSRELTHER
ncbi:hypothetical protein GCM10028833_37080 [Glycomyces tarimensis]